MTTRPLTIDLTTRPGATIEAYQHGPAVVLTAGDLRVILNRDQADQIGYELIAAGVPSHQRRRGKP